MSLYPPYLPASCSLDPLRPALIFRLPDLPRTELWSQFRQKLLCLPDRSFWTARVHLLYAVPQPQSHVIRNAFLLVPRSVRPVTQVMSYPVAIQENLNSSVFDSLFLGRQRVGTLPSASHPVPVACTLLMSLRFLFGVIPQASSLALPHRMRATRCLSWLCRAVPTAVCWKWLCLLHHGQDHGSAWVPLLPPLHL